MGLIRNQKYSQGYRGFESLALCQKSANSFADFFCFVAVRVVEGARIGQPDCVRSYYLYGQNKKLLAMAKPTSRIKKSLKMKLLNSSGKEIEGIILSGRFPKEDPTLAIAKHLKPTSIP